MEGQATSMFWSSNGDRKIEEKFKLSLTSRDKMGSFTPFSMALLSFQNTLESSILYRKVKKKKLYQVSLPPKRVQGN